MYSLCSSTSAFMQPFEPNLTPFKHEKTAECSLQLTERRQIAISSHKKEEKPSAPLLKDARPREIRANKWVDEVVPAEKPSP